MGMSSSAMGLIMAAAGKAGEKPKVPEFTPVDIGKASTDASNANLASFGMWADLAEKSNKLSIDELLKNMERLSPGSSKMFEQGSNMAQSWMRGELPQDLQDNIQRAAATRAMAGGYAGSEMSHNLTTRDLGLNSLQLSQQGLSAAMNWLKMESSLAPQFNFASMFVTPAQAIQTQMFNSENIWNQQWLRNQINAMPSPLDTAWMNAGMGFGGAIDQVGGTALGMMGGSGQPLGDSGGTFTPTNYGGMAKDYME